MYQPIADCIRSLVISFLDPEGEVTKKFRPDPAAKPKRRQPAYKNKSNRSDYFKNYMQEYREEGKDYQKVPDKIKKYRREQKEKMNKKFGL